MHKLKPFAFVAGLAITGVLAANVPASAAQTSSTMHAPQNVVSAVVTKDIDGDTIKVRIGSKTETVRMLLIDTPEDVDPKLPVEPFAREAAAYAQRLLPTGKRIWLQEGHPGHTRDKYERLLAYVWITSTDMYNWDVVHEGLARVAYVYPPNTDYLAQLNAAQNYAKAHHLGIWSIPGYVTAQGFNLDAARQWFKTHSGSSNSGSSSNGTSSSGTSAPDNTIGSSSSSTGTGTVNPGSPSNSTSSVSSPDSGSSTTPPAPPKDTGTGSTTDASGGSSTSTAPSSGQSITVISSNLNVQRGGYASVTIQTTPGALGTIEVDYKSGPSHASGLEPKTADSSGYITWQWRVSSSTTPGQWPVIITVGGQSVSLTLTVN